MVQYDIKTCKMVGAETNTEMLRLGSIESIYGVKLDYDLKDRFRDESFTINPIEIQILRELQKAKGQSNG